MFICRYYIDVSAVWPTAPAPHTSAGRPDAAESFQQKELDDRRCRGPVDHWSGSGSGSGGSDVVAEMIQVIILPAALLSSFPGYSLPPTYTALLPLFLSSISCLAGQSISGRTAQPGRESAGFLASKIRPLSERFSGTKRGSASPAAQGLEIGWSTALQVAVRLCTYPPTAPLRRPAPLDTSHFADRVSSLSG